MGQQRLVGGDHVLPGGDGSFHRRLGRAFRAADELHHAIDLARGGQGDGIVEPGHAGEIEAAVAGLVARGDGGDAHLAPRGGSDGFGTASHHPDDGSADGAETGDAEAEAL